MKKLIILFTILCSSIFGQSNRIAQREDYILFNGENKIIITLLLESNKAEIKISPVHDSVSSYHNIECQYIFSKDEIVLKGDSKNLRLKKTKTNIKIGSIHTATKGYICIYSDFKGILVNNEFLDKYTLDLFLSELGLYYKL